MIDMRAPQISIKAEEELKIVRCRSYEDEEWWEWNFWLVKKRKLFPIYVSGDMAGCRVMTQQRFDRCIKSMPGYSHFETITSNTLDILPTELMNFGVVVLKESGVDPKWTCSRCRRLTTGQVRFVGRSGGCDFDLDPICEECFEIGGRCSDCGCEVGWDGERRCRAHPESMVLDFVDEGEALGFDFHSVESRVAFDRG